MNGIQIMRSSRPALAMAIASMLASNAHAAETTGQKAATLAARAGLGAAKLWMEHESMTIPPSSLDPDQQNAKINASLEQYAATRNAYAGAKTGGEAIKTAAEVVVAGAAVSVGPQAAVTVPLTLIGAAATLSIDLANREVEKMGEERARVLLSSIKDDLVEQAGSNDYEALRSDPELLRKTLRENGEFLRDVKQRAEASGDQKLVDVAVDVIARSAAENGEQALVAVSQVGIDVKSMDERLGAFISETRESSKRIGDALDDQARNIEAIGEDVVKLTEEVGVVSAKVDDLGRNQDLIADFMFSSMPASEKARALRSGLMDRRIICPPESQDCNPAEIKRAMIKRFDTETRIAANVQLAGQVIKGVNDVSLIAANLGINLGEDGNKILSIAATAANAYIGFMAGDYLGSISAITGLFGKKPDPDAERFKIMMSYLKEQFGVVNQKLDRILENQKVILDAVVGLSKQLETAYVSLDGRLDQMQYEQRRISDNVKSLIWKDWASCLNVYNYAVNPNPAEFEASIVEIQTLRFRSFGAARRVVDSRSTEVKACLHTVGNSLATLSATKWFGNFLDADRALAPEGALDPNTLSAAVGEDANRWRDLLRLHRENVVDPALSISREYMARHGISPATDLYLMASSIPDTKALSEFQVAIAGGLGFHCDSREPGHRAIRGLVCMPGRDADEMASELTGTVLSTDILLDIGDWMIVVSQLADLYDEPDGTFAKTLDEMATMPQVSRGEEVMQKLTDVFTLAIAYHTRIHGGLTAGAVAEDILAQRADGRHRRLLANNPYMAENTANILLHRTRGTPDFRSDAAVPTFGSRYAQAYLHARTEGADRFEPLAALFGRERPFELTPGGAVGMRIATSEGDVVIPLPAPVRLEEGTFVFPPRRDVLLARRDRMMERYLDYAFGHDRELAAIALPH